jgi:hypothetical protein
VIGYEKLYEVSSYGRVRRLPSVVTQISRWGGMVDRRFRERLLVQTVDKRAYGRLQVRLCRGTKKDQKTRLVHQLVAEAFISSRPAGYEVAHLDGDAANNCVENLAYQTAKQNTADKVRHGTQTRGEKHGTSKLNDGQVRRIVAMFGKVKQCVIAKKFGISDAQISRIKHRIQWQHM